MSNFLLTTDDNIQKQYNDIDVVISVPSAGTTYNTTGENLSDVRVWVKAALFPGWRLLNNSLLIHQFTGGEFITGYVSIDNNNVSVILQNSSGSTMNVTTKIRVYYND